MKKLAVVTLLIVAVLIMTEFPRQAKADVIYGCYLKYSGYLRIVNDPSQCKSWEFPISWNQMGSPGIGAIKVFDANEQFLGMLLDLAAGAEIYIPSFSAVIRIGTTTGDTLIGAELYFQSSGCTGQPYINAAYSYLISKTGGDYYIGEYIAPVSVQINSTYVFWMVPPEEFEWRCIETNYTASGLVPAIKITQLPFTLPAALPLRFE
jgi:hypothetical protein